MKKLFAALLALLILASCLPMSYAASLDLEEADPYYIWDSGVMEDLSRVYVDGKPFSEDDYPKDPDADYMTLLHFQEYGFHPESDDHYGIFIYVYNPACLTVRDEKNTLQLCPDIPNFEHGYNKQKLTLIDRSEDGRFLKFEVDSVYQGDMLTEFLDPEARKYSVSGIEINSKEKGLVDYNVSGEYVFTGTQYTGDLKSNVDSLLTIELDLYHTFFRTETSSKGKDYQNQIDTVYFALDDWLMEKYGEVYGIHLDYTKRRINGVVTNNVDAYDAIMPYVKAGLPISSYPLDGNKIANTHWAWASTDLELSKPVFGWNISAENYLRYIQFLWIVMDLKDTVKGEYISKFLKDNEILSKVDSWSDNDSMGMVSWIPTESKTPWLTIARSFDMLSYKHDHSWLRELIDFGLFHGKLPDDSYLDIKAIVPVGESDLLGEDDSISEKLFVDASDLTDLKDLVSQSKGKTVYLFRFETQDYFSQDVIAYDYDENDIVFTGGLGSMDISWDYEDDTVSGYYFEETIYQDFDVIEIAFRDKYKNLTILPTVASPVDIIGDATPPYVAPLGVLGLFGGDSDNNSWKQIVAIIAVVLLVVFVIWLISKFIPKKVKVVNQSSGRRRRRR